MPFTLKIPSFVQGGDIPRHHTCDGANVSPQITWTDPPAGAQSFALIMDDPDAPNGTFVHWVLFDIPAARSDIPAEFRPGLVGVSGLNGRNELDYFGPCPPAGIHRYFFHLTAVDVPSLGLPERATRKRVDEALAPHSVGVAEYMGRYSRR